jgi:hypothetical protein
LLGFFHSRPPSMAILMLSTSAALTISTALFGESTFHRPSVPKIRHLRKENKK